MGNPTTLALWHERQAILEANGVQISDDDIDYAERREMVRVRNSRPIEQGNDSRYMNDEMILAGRLA